MSKEKVVKKMQKNIDRNVWLITLFSLILLISGGYFFYQFMQGYSYDTYLADGRDCYRLGEYDCAVLNSNRAEEFDPFGTELMELKGDLFLNYYKQEQKAIDHYTLSINRATPERKAMLLFKRAKIHQSMGAFNLCKEDLLLASKHHVDSVNLYLGEIFNYKEHDYSLAIRYYLKEESLLDDSFILNSGLGFAYYNNREFEKAIVSFDKSLDLLPTSGESFYFRGLSYNSLNEQKKACKDYQKAIELGYSEAFVSYDALCH
jgi:tetratricopeptide (TPR) repeat protein